VRRCGHGLETPRQVGLRAPARSRSKRQLVVLQSKPRRRGAAGRKRRSGRHQARVGRLGVWAIRPATGRGALELRRNKAVSSATGGFPQIGGSDRKQPRTGLLVARCECRPGRGHVPLETSPYLSGRPKGARCSYRTAAQGWGNCCEPFAFEAEASHGAVRNHWPEATEWAGDLGPMSVG